jgi:perosamine synthetase
MQTRELINFIRKLYPNKEEIIPLHEPLLDDTEKQYLADCIDSGFVSSAGAEIEKFENAIAEYTGSKNAIAVVNGTSALFISMRMLGIGENDLVITSPLSFIATTNAVIHTGAQPVFLDIDKENAGLSPEALKNFIQSECSFIDDKLIHQASGKRIKAVLPVHVFGLSCDIDTIKDICNTYKLYLLEDAAEGLGTTNNGKHIGTFGTCGILSFNGNKIITSGGGGMILTEDNNLASNIRHIVQQAKNKHPYEYIHDETGYNLRMPNLNASLGLAQYSKLQKIRESKRAISEKYQNFLLSKGIAWLKESEGSQSNYWLNVMLAENKEQRDTIINRLISNGIQARPAWKLSSDLPMYKNCINDSLENAKWLYERVICLPSSPIL